MEQQLCAPGNKFFYLATCGDVTVYNATPMLYTGVKCSDAAAMGPPAQRLCTMHAPVRDHVVHAATHATASRNAG
jgi:hypothetical protein